MGFDYGEEKEDESFLAEYEEACNMEKTRLYESGKYGNTTFNNIELGAVEAATGFGENKVILNGNFSLNLVNTAKYGEQLQIQVYSKDFVTKNRFHTSWNRTEIFFKADMVQQLIDSLLILQKRLVDNQPANTQ
jgi:hypothetical protein